MRMVVMLEKLEMVLSYSDMRELAERLRRDVVRATVHDPCEWKRRVTTSYIFRRWGSDARLT